jgi:long-subunit fatty acid transport protein
MKCNLIAFFRTHFLVAIIICLSSLSALAQDNAKENKWRFGGSLGIGFGTGYTDVTLAPGVLYQFNDYVALGAGLQGSYIKQRNYFSSVMYGGSVIGLYNPLPQVQLSAEVEQLRVNLEVEDRIYGDYSRNFWNTALFLGAGYRMENVTVGLRYNVLFNEDDMVYNSALMPFIRVYF